MSTFRMTLSLALAAAATGCLADPIDAPGEELAAAQDELSIGTVYVPPIEIYCPTLDQAVADLRARGVEPGALRVATETYREHDSAAVWKKTADAKSCAFEIHGAIFAKWRALGGLGFLGGPLTNESPTSGRFGRYNHFQGGSIYWTPSTGAQTIYGAIRQHWFNLDRQNGWLGFPTTDELANPVGRHNDFEGGAIYFTWATNRACAITPAIRDKWRAIGGPGTEHYHSCDSNVPTPTKDGRGKYAWFSTSNRIMEGPTGTFAVLSNFGYHFDDHLAETGYPIADSTYCGDLLWLQNYERQTVIWDNPTSRTLIAAGKLSCSQARDLARPPTCTATRWDFCCKGAVNETITKYACSRAAAIDQIEDSGPHCAGLLYDGACPAPPAAPCGGAGYSAYDFCCASTGSTVTGLGCSESEAKSNASSWWASTYGWSCPLADDACY